jgi:8-oxo-dGTP diphosphatase
MPASDQGISYNRFLLIPRTLIFLTRGDTVLLLKGSPDKRIWAGSYNGIGGHVERGEDILSAAQRELHEEAGLEGIDLWLCGLVTVDAGEQIGVGIFVLRGEYERQDLGGPGEILNSPEGTLEWVPISRLETLPTVEDLPILLPRVFNTRRGDPPFFARSYYDDSGRLTVIFNEIDL